LFSKGTLEYIGGLEQYQVQNFHERFSVGYDHPRARAQTQLSPEGK